jgi:hypothetical protein
MMSQINELSVDIFETVFSDLIELVYILLFILPPELR